MNIHKRIVGIVGVGHVGAHTAFTLGMLGIADEILLCDVRERQLESEWLDLMDAVKFMPHQVTYRQVCYEEMGCCQIIINSIGPEKRFVVEDRNVEMTVTARETARYVPLVMAGGFQGIFLNITNPCDVITSIIAEKSGLPQGHVLGTGTGLDTARLVSILSRQTGFSHRSITAFMMGEHGSSQIVPWSLVRFGGRALADFAGDLRFAFDRQKLKEQTINEGWLIYSGKESTEYGICSTAASMVKAIFHDEKAVLAASVPLNGEYGETGIFCGCPAVIGANGVDEVLEYPLLPEELAQFKACCAAIRANRHAAEDILA